MTPKAGSYFFWWLLIAVAFCCLPLFAATIEKPLADVTEEKRAQALFGELRCVVCEGQSLADSDNALAKQMRAKVRDMVQMGASDDEVLGYFTEQYGPSVRMAPVFEGAMLIIWLTPLLLLVTGAFLLRSVFRRRA